MQSLYSTQTVNNEIELCEISDLTCKQQIERELLKNQISYYVYWIKPSFFSRKKASCIFCINDSARDSADNIVRSRCAEFGYDVRFILRKSQNNYL